MSDKKSLDRLFQEKFKDFEFEPHPQVWKNIEAALKEKDDRKVIPFWWKLSGVAAVLLVGLFAWNLISDKSAPENAVVIEQKKASQGENDAVVERQEPGAKSQEHKKATNPGIASGENEIVNPNGKSTVNTNDNAVAEESDAITDTKSKNNKNSTIVNSDNNAVAHSTKINKKKTSESAFQNNGINTAVASENNASGQNKSKGKNRFKTTKVNAVSHNSAIAGVSSEQSKNNQSTNPTVPDQRHFGESQPEKGVASTGSNKNDVNNTNTVNQNIATEQKVAVKELPDNNKLDTVPAMTVPNPLEELLRQKNEKETKVAVTKLNRWQISSNVAPVYFSSTSQGSPIDKQFAGNDKTYENNLTYGIGVNYAVSKKLSVRAGVQKLDFNYNTNDVVFYAGLGAKAFNNISPAGNAAFLEVMSQNAAASIGLVPGDNSLQDISTGAMTQKMGYIEVPLELSYKLLDRKFGISVIGGLSTLFLNENEVTVASSSSATTAVLGKANNLNDVHFSSNLGVGFKYSFWKDFQFNFEPTFKYQINTFSKDAGNFKPYFIGLYSGISFKF